MAYVLKKIETLKEKVEFEIPTDFGSKPQKGDLIVEYRRYSVDEVVEYKNKSEEALKERLQNDRLIQAGLSPADDTSEENETDCLYDDIKGIEGILDEDDNPVEFKKELHLYGLLQEPFLRKALMRGWLKVVLGLSEKELKAKNL